MNGMRNNLSLRPAPAYPNEADTSYYMHKLLDIVTGIISGFGLVVCILFMAVIM